MPKQHKPDLMDFEKNLNARTFARKKAIKKVMTIAQVEADELVPYVAIAVTRMKASGWTSAPLRALMNNLKDGGVDEKDFDRVKRILRDALGFFVRDNFPTVFRMPDELPVIEDGKVVKKAVYTTPAPTPAPLPPTE